MCECLNEEESNANSTSSSQTATDKQDLQAPFTILQVEINKSALNLISSESESSADHDVQACREEIIENVLVCPYEENEKGKEEREESLKSCSCTEACESEKCERISSHLTEESEALECTLAIIKPEAMIFRKEIERTIVNEGFSVCQARWLQMTAEQVSDFYADKYEQDEFARLVNYMSSGPILVFVISKINAAKEWLLLMGPTKISEAKLYAPDSIRGKYGRKGDELKNVVHGSATRKDAEREIHFFFPDYVIEKSFSANVAMEYLLKEMSGLLTQGLVKCCEIKPEDPVIWLGNWLLDNNTRRPKYL